MAEPGGACLQRSLAHRSGDGNTPTGLIEFDLNSPEDDPQLFGPYPVNRAVQVCADARLAAAPGAVHAAARTNMLPRTCGGGGGAQGIRGNAAWLIPNIRDGILMHTGAWPGWAPPMVMPNSEGCIHAWPASIERVWHTLVGLGVQVRPNTDGKLPYPYKPQGLLSVALID